MPVDPQAQALLDQAARQPGPPLSAQTPEQARLVMLASTPLLGPPPNVARSEDRFILGPAGPLRVRITVPEGSGPFPAVVYYHGGGWVIGSIETHDALCRAMTNAAQAIVVSVDYRLAPKHPFPAAVDDAHAAAVWVSEHAAELGADPKRLVVAGDSAGGNLAAVVALRARARGAPAVALQVLLYPIADCDFETVSYREHADGYMLTREGMIWFWNHYVPDPQRRLEPDASPLRVVDPTGAAPALVLTAEYDPLRDEGEAYASRLAEAGVPVTLTRYDGMIHGFIRRYHQLDQGRAALDQIGTAIRSLHRRE